MGNYWSKAEAEIERSYGWKRDVPDERDLVHKFTLMQTQQDIKVVDLRKNCPPIYNQGKLGSCTANAIAAAYEFDEIKQQEKDPFTPSRLFIYYNERKLEHTTSKDNGASIRDSVKTINKDGVCKETTYPYDITKFANKPPQECYDEAKNHKCVEYKRVEQTLEQLKQCLIEGFPIVFGFDVYESFKETETTGTTPIPKDGEKCAGGHAICVVGFSEDKQAFLCRNSWGKDWCLQMQGYFYMPYDYILNPKLAGDFWTVRRVVDN